jgi:hypothetical protein
VLRAVAERVLVAWVLVAWVSIIHGVGGSVAGGREGDGRRSRAAVPRLQASDPRLSVSNGSGRGRSGVREIHGGRGP